MTDPEPEKPAASTAAKVPVHSNLTAADAAVLRQAADLLIRDAEQLEGWVLVASRINPRSIPQLRRWAASAAKHARQKRAAAEECRHSAMRFGWLEGE